MPYLTNSEIASGSLQSGCPTSTRPIIRSINASPTGKASISVQTISVLVGFYPYSGANGNTYHREECQAQRSNQILVLLQALGSTWKSFLNLDSLTKPPPLRELPPEQWEAHLQHPGMYMWSGIPVWYSLSVCWLRAMIKKCHSHPYSRHPEMRTQGRESDTRGPFHRHIYRLPSCRLYGFGMRNLRAWVDY